MFIHRRFIPLLKIYKVSQPLKRYISTNQHPTLFNIFRAHVKRYKLPYSVLLVGTATGITSLQLLNLKNNLFEHVPFFKAIEVPPPIPSTCEQESLAQPNDDTNLLCLRTIISLIWDDISYLLLAVLGACGAAYFNICIPLLFGDLVNMLAELTQTHNFPVNMLRAPSIRLCGAFSMQSLCTCVYIGFLATVGERLSARLKSILLEKIIFQRIRFFDKTTSGFLIERITSDVQDFKSSFKLCISQGLRSGAQTVGSTIAMYMISPTLTTVLMGCLPFVFLVGSLIGSQLRRISCKAQEADNEAMETAMETFTHIRSVKALAMESYLLDNFSKQVNTASGLHEMLGYGIGCFQGLSNFALNGVVLGVLYLGGNLMAKRDLDAGQLMSFLVASQSVHRSLAQISLLFGHIVRGTAAANRISDLLSLPGPDEAISYTRGLSSLPDSFPFPPTSPLSVRFENVRFSYPDRADALVFEDLSFEIPQGKVVAFVGESGAGKSTVLSLLERFYEPSAGRILINNIDIREFSLASLRGKILGYISQEPEIFHATVAENISYAKPTASEDEITAAAIKAQANGFVRDQLPLGYATKIGGGSSSSSAGLSGGQRQRLIIARALLKDAPILLLDEATSALDAESEFQVQSALQNAMSGRTVIIVAHRLSTIRGADYIFVMHKGQIVERGTHGELLHLKGRYYELLQRQSGEDDIL